ncbi:MAG: acyltransferase [Burkholderiaceae bacterium]|nr:acyltransferase [Burkholderiaceae bacterium]
MNSSSSRWLHLDLLKALAAQAIVLHHLAAYGPIADTVQTLLPGLMDWLYEYGRMAVQVFLVIGGFLCARGLAPAGQLRTANPLALLWQRHLRLALPFMAAVLLTLACSALVAPWLPELVPESVGLGQVLAHALLLHGVLGQESLTVGAWYVAIDLQLFALLLGLLWLAGRLDPAAARRIGPLLVLAMVMASLWVFNLMPELDMWAPYFFGSYGLGALVYWQGLNPRWRPALLVGALVLAALAFDFRERIALALATALLLAWLQHRHVRGRPLLAEGSAARGLAPVLAHAGTHAYALFLVHFPVCLLVNALFDHADPEHPYSGLVAMGAAWLLSNMAALLFYRWIEAPAGRLRLALPGLRRA